LGVWWFGGTEQSDNNNNEDSCELVAVRIERTSPNSRRIAGEISVPAPLEAVWSILTDYNRLAIHVPNLMESKIVRENGPGNPGDGSYKCRLYQVGAQKIIGFDFSASVTMDMSERVIASAAAPARKIDFKCVDSQFFSEFDGAWTVKEQRNPATGEIETLCSYVVDVRPKGPVPVAALEWRIREDVPTNLRAVKAATLAMNPATMATRKATAAAPTTSSTVAASNARPATQSSTSTKTQKTPRQVPVRLPNRKAAATASQTPQVPAPRLASVLMDWDVDETMGKYL
jgi:Polyketide cyclase / dehydrase and lipid transport